MGLGQLGGILVFGVFLFVRGVERKQPLIGAAGLLLLSLKPHLSFPAIIALLLRRETHRIYLATVPLFLLILSTISFWRPDIITDWAQNASRVQIEGATSPFQWRTGSLTTLFGGISPKTLPAYMVLEVAVLVALGIFLRKAPIHLTITRTLAVGAVISPFCWLFDLTLLLPVLAQTVCSAEPGKSLRGRMPVISVIIFNAVSWILFTFFTPTYDSFVWFGPTLLLLSVTLTLFSNRLLNLQA